MKSFAGRLLVGVAAVAVVVSGCGVASKGCPPTGSSGGSTGRAAVTAGGDAAGGGTLTVPGNPSAPVNPSPPRYLPDPLIPGLEAACWRAADVAGADQVCQAKLRQLLPLLTQLCPKHSHHMCLAWGFIAGQPDAVVKIINSLGGDVTCPKAKVAMCIGILVSKVTADKAPPAASPPAASPSVTPSTTATPSAPPAGSPEPSVSTPAPADSPGGTPADMTQTSPASSPQPNAG